MKSYEFDRIHTPDKSHLFCGRRRQSRQKGKFAGRSLLVTWCVAKTGGATPSLTTHPECCGSGIFSTDAASAQEREGFQNGNRVKTNFVKDPHVDSGEKKDYKQCCGAGAGLFFAEAGAGEKAPALGCCCVA